jgi:predicted transcriptional regulator
MKLSEVIERLGLKVLSPGKPDTEVSHGYCSDMLSDVIANAGAESVWVTMQTHANVIAVAALKDVAAIIIVGGHQPAPETVKLAADKGVCVLGAEQSAFDAAGLLYGAGLRGATK